MSSQPQDPYASILSDFQPTGSADPFDQLDTEFQQSYGRPLRFTGRDTKAHIRLHGPGQARDIGVRDLSGDELKFILKRGPELGLNLRDYSKTKPFTTGTGVRITGPHIHLDRDRVKLGDTSNLKQVADPYAAILSKSEVPGGTSEDDPYASILLDLGKRSAQSPVAASQTPASPAIASAPDLSRGAKQASQGPPTTSVMDIGGPGGDVWRLGQDPATGGTGIIAPKDRIVPSLTMQDLFGAGEPNVQTLDSLRRPASEHAAELENAPLEMTEGRRPGETEKLSSVTPMSTSADLAKRRVDLSIIRMHQVGSPVEIPGYKEAVDAFNQDVEHYNKSLPSGVLRVAQSHPKITTRGALPSETIEVAGGEAMSEGELYGQWYKARASGDLETTNAIAQNYLEQFPRGKYAKYIAAGVKQFAPATVQVEQQPGAGAYVPVKDIETMRGKGMKDAEILRAIQDSAARQIGLSASDVAALTEKYGQHPLANIVEPGTNARSSLDSIIKQGKSNAGLAEFNILPATIAAFHKDQKTFKPEAVLSAQAVQSVGHTDAATFLSQLATDPKIMIETPEIASVAKYLSESPKALKLMAAITSGGLEVASGQAHMQANIGSLFRLSRFADSLNNYADEFADMAANTAKSAGEDYATTRKTARLFINLLPIMLAAQAGAFAAGAIGEAPYIGTSLALATLGGAEHAHQGPKVAIISAALLGGSYFVMASSGLAPAINEWVAKGLGPTEKMAAEALSAGTKQEAINAASRMLAQRLIAERIGVAAGQVTNLAQFLATSAAIHAAGEGRAMTKEEIVQAALVFAAVGLPELARGTAEIPGEVITRKSEAEAAITAESLRTARNITTLRTPQGKAIGEGEEPPVPFNMPPEVRPPGPRPGTPGGAALEIKAEEVPSGIKSELSRPSGAEAVAGPKETTGAIEAGKAAGVEAIQGKPAGAQKATITKPTRIPLSVKATTDRTGQGIFMKEDVTGWHAEKTNEHGMLLLNSPDGKQRVYVKPEDLSLEQQTALGIQKGEAHAEAIRGDQGQLREEGRAGKEGEGTRGANLYQEGQGRKPVEPSEGVAGRPTAVAERQAPVVTTVDEAAHEAATSPQNELPEPTRPQIVAGNYAHGHVRVGGLDVSIEHPQGAIRTGIGEGGKPWQRRMGTHYGYLKATEGNDGQQVDVHILPGVKTDYSGPVFVVNQTKADGSFDEHKVMLGWPNEKSARKGYLSNYERGWNRVGSIAKFDNPTEFKTWLDSGNLNVPAVSPQKGAIDEERKARAEVGRHGEAGRAEAPYAAQQRGGAGEEGAGYAGQAVQGGRPLHVTEGAVVAEEPARVPGVEGVVSRARQGERRAQIEGAIDQQTQLQNKGQWIKAQPHAEADPNREIAVLDLNNLKQANDTYGHAIGDRYIEHAATAIREEAKKVGIPERDLFRTGGDEFHVIGNKGKLAPVIKAIKARVAEFKHGDFIGSAAAGIGPTTKGADALAYADKKQMKAIGVPKAAEAKPPTEAKPAGPPPRITKSPTAEMPTQKRKRLAVDLKAELARMEEPPSELARGVAGWFLNANVPAKLTWQEKPGYLAVNAGAIYALNKIRGTASGQSVRGLTFNRANSEEYAARAVKLAEDATGVQRDNLLAVAAALRETGAKHEEFAVVGKIGLRPGSTVRHELTHVAQMALERFFQNSPHPREIVTLPHYEKVSQGLIAKGYPINYGPQVLAHEGFAHIAGGQRDLLGLSVKEANDFAYGYFELIGRTYRADALRRFDALNSELGRLRDEVQRKLKAEQIAGVPTAASRVSTQGIPRGAEGGQARVAQANVEAGAPLEEITSYDAIPLSPRVKELLSEISRSYIEEGRTDIDGLIGEFEDLLGDQFDKVSDYLPKILGREEERAKSAILPASKVGEAARDYGTIERPNIDALSQTIAEKFLAGERFNRITEARAFAGKLLGAQVAPGTQIAKQIDEAVELAVSKAAREISRTAVTHQEAYTRLVDLYDRQPNLGVKTSTSVLQQAYSTPVPIAYIASVSAGTFFDSKTYEPTAGNGALLVEVDPEYIQANELNPERADNLRSLLPGATVTQQDATEYVPREKVDVVLANPPFGAVKEGAGEQMRSKEWRIGGLYDTKEVDHAIAWKALEAMKDDGRAVLILGGINSEDPKVRSDAYNGRQKRLFYYTLYNHYNVVDHFTVSGDLYQKQGAGWPIDMIVIQGRGKSSRALPAVDVPRIYRSFDELGEVLNAPYTKQRGVVSPTVRAPGVSEPGQERPGVVGRGGVAQGPERIQPRGVFPTARGEGPATTRPGTEPGERGVGPIPPTSVSGAGRPTTGERARGGERAGISESGALGLPGAVGRAGQTPEELAGGERQGTVTTQQGKPGRVGEYIGGEAGGIGGVEPAQEIPYQPASKQEAIGTLVPMNLVTTTQGALRRLEAKVGDLDAYVSRALQYDPATIGQYFSAEQVDALALALHNMEGGAGFIIGDQAGIGKGRVVAGIIKHAILQGRVPIFVTEKPNLYKDIYRDLVDIGMNDIRPLMTNAGQRIALDDDETVVLKSPTAGSHNAALNEMVDRGDIGEHNMVFTTYSQMQTIKGAHTPRQGFLLHFAEDGIIIFDESHNAGGAEKQEDRGAKNAPDDRAKFARRIAGLAHGVFYSSATYAKRPQVMDLYFTTDMKLAVNGVISRLAPAITQGGVPLQQVVASMLTEAGQYIRRERSFEGVNYDTRIAAVDRVSAEGVSRVMRAIQAFEPIKQHVIDNLKEELKAEARHLGVDTSTGTSGVHSTNFTSIMHNLIDQMLLSLKVEAAVTEAVDALKRGEKPVITVANTMGSFIQHYAEDNDLRPGDALGLNFGSLLKRYLERSRTVLIGTPYGPKESHYLTDEQIGTLGVQMYKNIQKLVDETDWSGMPISPIDYMKDKLAKAAYKVGEITGRHHIVDYSSGTPRYMLRSGKEISTSGRNNTLMGFNNGGLDAMIMNQAGSTGLSAHASSKFKDQRRRFMIIAQAERNIDTHMQMMFRIKRTGEVVTPNYVQLVADIPAEKRPAAVLAKKMASLNANTTASRGGVLTSREVVDFMNDYGDEIAASIMEDDPELHAKLGKPLKNNETGTGFAREGAIRRTTGRIPLLPIAEQEHLYDQIENEYKELITRLEAMGENALEAKTLELDAKPIKKTSVFETGIQPGYGEELSPFARGADAELMDVKRLGKPMTSVQVLDALRHHFGDYATDAEFEVLQAGGKKELTARREDLRARTIAYKAETIDTIEDTERRVAQETRLNDVARRLNTTLGRATVGAQVKIESPQGSFYGIVTKVEQKGASKNPIALGSWRITVAVADGMRQIVLPVSKILNERGDSTFSGGSILLETADHVPAELGSMPILEYFDHAQTESRERRTIITGNLLAGFSQFVKGQIINFRDHEGNIRQGILMPRAFNIAKAMEDQPVAFSTSKQVLSFLDRVPGLVLSGDEILRIRKQGDDFNFSVPSAKAVGGKYFLNAEILKVSDPDEFVKAGQTMRLLVTRKVAAKVIDALLANDTVLNTRTHKDEARAITGRVLPEERRAKTEAEAREQGPKTTGLPQAGGAPTGLGDWFRNRRNMITGQFTGLPTTYSGLTGGAGKSVASAWDKFKNLFIRNLSRLERVSPEAHAFALRAGGSRGQATVLLQIAANKIDQELKGSGISWPMVRAALVESRLRGIRERYLDLAQQAFDATDEELADAFQNGMAGVLQHIEGRAGLDDTLAQRATAMLDAGDFDALRNFLGATFEIAADNVGRVNMGPDPNAFETLTVHPAFNRALRLYKDLMEGPIAESHSINEGVFSDALGPLNTYYPLIAVREDGGILHRLFGATKIPYRKPKNIANYFATGLASHGYSLEMTDFAERIKSAIRVNNKAALLSELDAQSLIRVLGKNERAPGTGGTYEMDIDGEMVGAQLVDTGSDLLIVRPEGNLRIPGARALVPNWLAKELKQILDREKIEPGMGDALVNKIIQASLIGPMDLTWHSFNIIGTLVANTPFIGRSIPGAIIGGTPATKLFASIIQLVRTDPTTEESIRDLMEMANLGLIPPRFGSATYSRRYAELTGAKRVMFSGGPLLYGPKGLDVRARLVMWRAAKMMNPGATPAQLFKFVTQLGVYNRELESAVERFAKATRLAPFATAGMTMWRNGINAWTGTGPKPVNGAAAKSAYYIAQMLSGGAAGLILLWALTYKAYKKKWPQDDPEARLLQIPLNEGDRNSQIARTLFGLDPTKTAYLNFAFFSPLVSRGSRALGIAGAFGTRALGGTKGQQLEYAQRDIYNSLSHPFTTGPLVRAPFIFATGKEPGLTSLRDITGQFGPQFFPATVKAAPGFPTLGRRAEEAVLNINPFAKMIAGSFGIGEKGEQMERQQSSRWARMLTDIVAPRLIGSAVDTVAARQRIAKEEKAATSKPAPEAKLPDDVRMEMHRVELIPSKSQRKPSESDADYLKRSENAAEGIAARVKALLGSESYKGMNKEQKKETLQRIIKDERHDSSAAPKGQSEAEKNLLLERNVVEDRLRVMLESRSEFQRLSEDDQKTVMRKLGEGFRMFSIPQKLSPAVKEKRAEKGIEMLKALESRGVFDKAIDRLLVEIRKKAA